MGNSNLLGCILFAIGLAVLVGAAGAALVIGIKSMMIGQTPPFYAVMRAICFSLVGVGLILIGTFFND